MQKNNLDEMQLQKRDRLGNQAFMMLFYLLMLDIGLYGFGVRWLNYPVNVFVIMLVCMTYYSVGLIIKNAYVGPRVGNLSFGLRIILTVVFAVVIAVAALLLTQTEVIQLNTAGQEDSSAMILLIISVVALIIMGVVSLVSKKQNSHSAEE